jgi:hypothetical protein
MRLCNINKSLQKTGNKMKYFEAVFYYFLLPSRGIVEKVLFNHKAREEGTKETKLKPCNSFR